MVTSDKTDFHGRLCQFQHIIHMVNQERLVDLLDDLAMDLDIVRVRAFFERLKGDLDLHQPISREYQSLSRFFQMQELTFYTDVGKFTKFISFAYERLDLNQGSFVDFLTRSNHHDFSVKGSSQGARSIMHLALTNLVTAVLLSFGIDCSLSAEPMLAMLLDGPHLQGVEDSYICFLIHMATRTRCRSCGPAHNSATAPCLVRKSSIGSLLVTSTWCVARYRNHTLPLQ